MLISRIITALILLPLAIYGILFLDLANFSIFLSVVFLIAAHEWANITKLSKLNHILFLLLILFFGSFLWINLAIEQIIAIPIISCLLWLFYFYQVINYPKIKLSSSNYVKIIIGISVILPAWLSMIMLKQQDSFQLDSIALAGGVSVLLLMCIVWIADTGAYFAGRKWGKTKLLPLVSPGKTRAGVYGAIILTILTFASIFLWNSQDIKLLILVLILVGLLVVISVLGDLFESMHKRMNDVKDSGHILPGHGGILDRIDSLIAVAPFFYLSIIVLEKF